MATHSPTQDHTYRLLTTVGIAWEVVFALLACGCVIFTAVRKPFRGKWWELIYYVLASAHAVLMVVFLILARDNLKADIMQSLPPVLWIAACVLFINYWAEIKFKSSKRTTWFYVFVGTSIVFVLLLSSAQILIYELLQNTNDKSSLIYTYSTSILATFYTLVAVLVFVFAMFVWQFLDEPNILKRALFIALVALFVLCNLFRAVNDILGGVAKVSYPINPTENNSVLIIQEGIPQLCLLVLRSSTMYRFTLPAEYTPLNSGPNDIVERTKQNSTKRPGIHRPEYTEVTVDTDNDAQKLVLALRNDPSIGFIEQKDLKLVKKLAQGAAGEVWEGLWGEVTPVAVKTVFERSKKRLKQKEARMLVKEIKLLSAIQHTNIVRCFGASAQRDNVVYLVMELAPGGSLGGLLSETPFLPRERIIRIAYEIVSGLSYLHSPQISIIHRDIKPDNLLFGTSGEIKIGDFGSAKLDRQSRTMTMNPGFTLIYSAPEIAREFSDDENPEYGASVDVYSFGAILYQMLVGKEPFPELEFIQVFRLMLSGSLRLIDEFEIPEAFPMLGELTQRCISIEPSERPTSKEVAILLLKHIQDDKTK